MSIPHPRQKNSMVSSKARDQQDFTVMLHFLRIHYVRYTQAYKWAAANPNNTRAFVGTLLPACSGGNTHSKVNKFEDTSDGDAASKGLLDWYDLDTNQESHTETLKLKLQSSNQLMPSRDILSGYINVFELIYHKFSKMPQSILLEIYRVKEDLLEGKADELLDIIVPKIHLNEEEMIPKYSLCSLHFARAKFCRRWSREPDIAQ
eukprot:jgi/Psemu1/8829/gm1.8829_g